LTFIRLASYRGYSNFQVIRIIGHTLAPFNETGIIRGFGFGDSETKDTSVFELDPQVMLQELRGMSHT